MGFSLMVMSSGLLLLQSTSAAMVRKRIGILVIWKNIGNLRCASIIKSQLGRGDPKKDFILECISIQG